MVDFFATHISWKPEPVKDKVAGYKTFKINIVEGGGARAGAAAGAAWRATERGPLGATAARPAQRPAPTAPCGP